MKSGRPPRSSYSIAEVEALIEEYESLREHKDTTRRGLRYLLSLADIDKTLPRLTRKQREALLLHGMIGLSADYAAELLGIERSSLLERYHHALHRLTTHLNGGT